MTLTISTTTKPTRLRRGDAERIAWAIALTGAILGGAWGAGLLTTAPEPSTSVTATAVDQPRHYGDGEVRTKVEYTGADGTTKSTSAPGSLKPGSTVTISVDSDGRVLEPAPNAITRLFGAIAGSVTTGILALMAGLLAYAALDRRIRR